MDVQDLKNTLAGYGIKPNFTYGQNFLVDDDALENILEAAAVKAGDEVLEVGPGIGTLTLRLLENGARVLAVEKDPAFLPVLKKIKKRFPETFRYELGDILDFNFQEYYQKNGVKSYAVVANIPYYITGKILQLFLTPAFKPTALTLLMQKETAQGAAAEAGDMTVLSLSVQLYGRPEIKAWVPAKSFYPAPKVDSAVLRVDIFPRPAYTVDEKKFFGLLRACFAGKRKQIHNTLEKNLRIPKQQVEKILKEIKIPATARPQELTLEKWVQLVEKI